MAYILVCPNQDVLISILTLQMENYFKQQPCYLMKQKLVSKNTTKAPDILNLWEDDDLDDSELIPTDDEIETVRRT
jgi:hypothetical protein